MMSSASIRVVLKRSRIWRFSAAMCLLVVGIKVALHSLGWEFVGVSTLYATIISGGFFVLGFILAAIIADYREADKIPTELAAVIENMAEDVAGIQALYPAVDAAGFAAQLHAVLTCLEEDLVGAHHHSTRQVHQLSRFFAQMEASHVPPNYIVKLKTEQGQLIRLLFRAYHIQSIHFIPSAILLAHSTVALIIGLLLVTDIEPASASVWLTGTLAFLLVYITRLIAVIGHPFQASGTSQDDVSLRDIEFAAKRLAGLHKSGQ